MTMLKWSPQTQEQFAAGRRVVVASELLRTASEYGHVSRRAKEARALRDLALYDAVKMGWPKKSVARIAGPIDDQTVVDACFRIHRWTEEKRDEHRLLMDGW
jgi:hypothetical protein